MNPEEQAAVSRLLADNERLQNELDSLRFDAEMMTEGAKAGYASLKSKYLALQQENRQLQKRIEFIATSLDKYGTMARAESEQAALDVRGKSDDLQRGIEATGKDPTTASKMLITSLMILEDIDGVIFDSKAITISHIPDDFSRDFHTRLFTVFGYQRHTAILEHEKIMFDLLPIIEADGRVIAEELLRNLREAKEYSNLNIRYVYSIWERIRSIPEAPAFPKNYLEMVWQWEQISRSKWHEDPATAAYHLGFKKSSSEHLRKCRKLYEQLEEISLTEDENL